MPSEEKALPLPELPAGQTVFIDANIFIYHFTGLSRECSRFLERCAWGDPCGISVLATVDPDFTQVDGLRVYRPLDLVER